MTATRRILCGGQTRFILKRTFHRKTEKRQQQNALRQNARDIKRSKLKVRSEIKGEKMQEVGKKKIHDEKTSKIAYRS